MTGTYLQPTKCPIGRPTAADSLIDLYGLRDFANSVARQDPVTGAKRKLRKSYKNHIGDLPGRHPIPIAGESKWDLVSSGIAPAAQEDALRALTIPDSMIQHLRIIPGPLPSFDTSLLAAPSPLTSESPGSVDKRDKRKRKDSGVGLEKRRKL